MTNARAKKIAINQALNRKLEDLLDSFGKIVRHFDSFEYRHPHNGHFSTNDGRIEIADSTRLVCDTANKLNEYLTAKALVKMGRMYV